MTDRTKRLGGAAAARFKTSTGAHVERMLTADDEDTLNSYVVTLDQAIAVLREEISLIKNGQLGAVGGLYEKKAELLKTLELRAPVVEPFLNHQHSKALGLQEKLSNLKATLVEDSEHLARMASVASTVLREIEKALNRSSLDGLYGKTGEKISKTARGKQQVNQEL